MAPLEAVGCLWRPLHTAVPPCRPGPQWMKHRRRQCRQSALGVDAHWGPPDVGTWVAGTAGVQGGHDQPCHLLAVQWGYDPHWRSSWDLV